MSIPRKSATTESAFFPSAPGVWSRLVCLAVFSIAMGLLEAICVVYLRRLLPVDGAAPVLPARHHHIEVIREACTIVMLAGVAWLAGIGGWSRVGCFFFAFGIWDILYYAGLWWFVGWPDSVFTWDCLFLIPVAWHGPVLAPVLISLYFVLGCCWLHAREIRRDPPPSLVPMVASQGLAFAIWYASFVKDSSWIAKHRYDGVTYSWLLFGLGTVFGIAGWWFSGCRPGSRMKD